VSESEINPSSHVSLSSTSPTRPQFQRTLKVNLILAGTKRFTCCRICPSFFDVTESCLCSV